MPRNRARLNLPHWVRQKLGLNFTRGILDSQRTVKRIFKAAKFPINLTGSDYLFIVLQLYDQQEGFKADVLIDKKSGKQIEKFHRGSHRVLQFKVVDNKDWNSLK